MRVRCEEGTTRAQHHLRQPSRLRLCSHGSRRKGRKHSRPMQMESHRYLSPCLQPSSPTVWYRDTRSNGALSWLDANAFATSRRDSRMPLHRHRVPSIVSGFGLPKFPLHEVSAFSLQTLYSVVPISALPLSTLDYRVLWSNMVRRIHQR